MQVKQFEIVPSPTRAEGIQIAILFAGENSGQRFSFSDFRKRAAPELRAAVAEKLRKMPRKLQGLKVVVSSRTGGATWVAEVYDALGDYRRDCMRADERLDEPHQSLAVDSAKKIARRLRCRVEIMSVENGYRRKN